MHKIPPYVVDTMDWLENFDESTLPNVPDHCIQTMNWFKSRDNENCVKMGNELEELFVDMAASILTKLDNK